MSQINHFSLINNNYTPVIVKGRLTETDSGLLPEYHLAIVNPEDGLAFKLSTVSFVSERIINNDGVEYYTDPIQEASRWLDIVKRKQVVDLRLWEPILDYTPH